MTRVEWYKLITDGITAAGTVFVAASVVVAVLTMRQEDKAKRLERTYALMHEFNRAEFEEEGARMLKYFPGRYEYPKIKKPMEYDLAQKLWGVSKIRYEKDNETVRKYNAARKHLNRVETLAFAYVHNTAEPKVLATLICPTLGRSNIYFEELIKVFRQVGPAQSWQVIPKAASMMQSAYGTECERLY
jgi:hypothetical protein